MARMHARKRGGSSSARPISKQPPSWVAYSPDEVEALAVKYAKSGIPPSAIGVTLRDQHGIPLIKSVTGKRLSKILAENNLMPEIPEDLRNLIDRARRMHVHLQAHRSDRYNRKRLQLVEAKIHRLVKHYKSLGRIPQDFQVQTLYKYE
jgi:small subunit ribosomal protein S15